MTAASAALPERFAGVDELEAFLSRPTPELVADLAAVDGDILILGVGGKMGPTLARLARNAAPEPPRDRRRALHRAGPAEVARAPPASRRSRPTSSQRGALQRLPRARNVILMAGRKFGAGGSEPLTWALNAYLPGLVAETFGESRIVAFSTGCVYPFVDVTGAGRDRVHAAHAAGRVRQLLRRP